MLISEHFDEHGEAQRTYLEVTDEGALLRVGESAGRVLPVRAVLLAMRKFGRELDPDIEPNAEALQLGDGVTVRPLLFRAAVDAEPRSYLVLEGDGKPLCAISSEVAAALRFLAEKSR